MGTIGAAILVAILLEVYPLVTFIGLVIWGIKYVIDSE